eukprot:4610334-Prymnesium_polylepis.2
MGRRHMGSVSSSFGGADLFGGGAYAAEAAAAAPPRRSAENPDFLSQLELAEARDSSALGQSTASRSAAKAARPQSAFAASSKQGSIVFGDDSRPETRAWLSSNADHQVEVRRMHEDRQHQERAQRQALEQRRLQLQREQQDPQRLEEVHQQREQQRQQRQLREQQQHWRTEQQRTGAWSDGNWHDAGDDRPMSALWDGDWQKAQAVAQMDAAGCKGSDKTVGRHGGWREVMRMNEYEMRGTVPTSVGELLTDDPPSLRRIRGSVPKRLPPSYNARGRESPYARSTDGLQR